MTNSTSVSAALTTISTLAATCSNHFQNVINISKYTPIPNEVLALSNEVSDIRAVLAEVETNHESIARSTTAIVRQAESSDVQLSYLLQRAQSILIELDKLVSSSIKLGRHNEQVFQRAVWLRRRKLSTAMLQDIRDIKQSIMLVIASKTA